MAAAALHREIYRRLTKGQPVTPVSWEDKACPLVLSLVLSRIQSSG
jgi:hypothetical protein